MHCRTVLIKTGCSVHMSSSSLSLLLLHLILLSESHYVGTIRAQGQFSYVTVTPTMSTRSYDTHVCTYAHSPSLKSSGILLLCCCCCCWSTGLHGIADGVWFALPITSSIVSIMSSMLKQVAAVGVFGLRLSQQAAFHTSSWACRVTPFWNEACKLVDRCYEGIGSGICLGL